MFPWLPSLALLFAASAPAPAVLLKPVDPAQFLVSPDQATVLQWRIASGAVSPTAECVVRDYGDRPVAQLPIRTAAGGTVSVEVRLPTGYYELDFPAAAQRFGLLAIAAPGAGAAADGAVRPDPFFAVDAALSWLVGPDEQRAALIKNLPRSGIGMARERLSWAQVNPARDRWEWDSSRRYETLRRAYAAQGVEVLEMFHDAPAWPKYVGKYPADLVATAAAWQAIGRRWRPLWQALEIWNEPDIFFGGNLPADQYVPLVHAISYGLRQAAVAPPIVGGVLAHDNPRFLDCAARNGLLIGVEAVSFHTYGRALSMEDLVGRYRRWLAAYGKDALPLWLTECGRPWKRGPARPPLAEDAESALDITMKAVEARACGIARYFAFVYPYYEEHDWNFGMTDRQGTPLRSLAAYAYAARVLSGKRYLGDLRCDVPAVKRARVFADQRETVAILYTAAYPTAGAAKLETPVLRAAGIDGRPLALAAEGAVPLGDGLVYVWLDGRSVDGRLQTETTAARLWALGQQPAPPVAPLSPIVLRYQVDPARVEATSEGYRVKAPPPAELPLVVRAFNLDTRPHELSLQLSLSDPAAAPVGPAVLRVTAPPAGFVDAEWRADVRQAFAKTGQLQVAIAARGDAADPIRPLAIDLAGEATLEQILARYGRAVRLPIGDLTAWRTNIVGHGRLTMQQTPEGHWQLDATFGKGDRWVYPIFQLPADVDLRRCAALVVRGRCERPAKVRILLHEGDTGVCYLTPEPIIPADGQWHAVAVPLRSLTLSTANAPDPNQRLDLDQVRRLSLGLNSEADQNRLQVSDLCLVAEP